MKSPAQAILWETLNRGRWSLPGFFLLANTMPFIVFSALGTFGHGGIEQDPSWAIMHFSFLWLSMAQAAIGIVTAQSTMSRLYAAPISTSSLVAWHMFPGAILLGVEIGILSTFNNYYFRLNQPVIGPVLFAMTAWCCTQLLIHQTHRTLLSVLASVTPIVILMVWLRSRYGEFNIHSAHLWNAVSIDDTAFLVIASIAAYLATTIAIARDRCSERILSFGITDRLLELWTERSTRQDVRRKPFASPAEAQLWYETRSKLWALPVITSLILGATILGWALNQVVPSARTLTLDDLQFAIFMCGGVAVFAAVIAGLVLGLGTVGGDRNNSFSQIVNQLDVYSMPSYLATKPMPSREFGNAIWRTAIRSVLISVAIWLVAYVGYLGLANLNHQYPKSLLPPALGMWYPLLTILGAWIAMIHVAAMSLSGRGTIFTYALVGTGLACVLIKTSAEMGIAKETMVQIQWGFAMIVSMSIIAFAFQTFRLAHSRAMVTRNELFIAASIALGLAGVCIATCPIRINTFVVVLVAAFAALTVSPIATIPLAIAWNRHR